jgi:alkylation response protein AidB-like acyl-CoA dehydrogenase
MIDLLPNDEQEALVEAASSLLERDLPLDRVREIAESGLGYDPAVWQQCADLGWFGLGLPESSGGVGYTLVEQALLFRELGRHLTPGPILATVLGAHVAELAGLASVRDDIIGGATVVGMAEHQRHTDEYVAWRCGPTDLLLLSDPEAGRLSLANFSVDLDERATDSIDPFHRLSRIKADEIATIIATDDSGATFTQGTVLVSAMMTGVAEAARDMGAAYTTNRFQFGRAIGSFQAVKHRAADTAIRSESAWAQTAVAALRVVAGSDDAAFQASSARVVASDAAIKNGRDLIQNHGAIGFTDEHDAHFFLKRAHLLEHHLGDTRLHLQMILDGAPA